MESFSSLCLGQYLANCGISRGEMHHHLVSNQRSFVFHNLDIENSSRRRSVFGLLC